jgi:hypothetical protein
MEIRAGDEGWPAGPGQAPDPDALQRPLRLFFDRSGAGPGDEDFRRRQFQAGRKLEALKRSRSIG